MHFPLSSVKFKPNSDNHAVTMSRLSLFMYNMDVVERKITIPLGVSLKTIKLEGVGLAREMALHQCDTGSIHGVDVTCVLRRIFPPVTPVSSKTIIVIIISLCNQFNTALTIVSWLQFSSPFICSLQGFDDEHCFDSEATKLTSRNMQNLKCLYNYKCFVSGGERCFIMGLGVRIL